MTVKTGDRLRITDASERWRLRHGPRVGTVTAVSHDKVQVHWHHTIDWWAVRGSRLVRGREWLETTPYSDSV